MERSGSKRFGRARNIMQSLRRRLSFRKKKEHVPACSKPHQWQEDEKKVREGTCCYQVRYLGYIEVFDSRGMHICEEAVKALKAQCKGKYQRAVLYVTGDALRVVDEISKSMIVDQTIEKVSFCAPDRNHEKGFAYICRDGTTRRWMCHGFLAVKESGERLSHAVGCAFAICLEKKQKREKETGVVVSYNQSRTSFERTGSFRQTTLTERIVDPQSAILAEPVPVRSATNPYAVQRPHATANLLERQGSFRGFEKLQETSSPFKRTLSLRLNELPSTLQRQNAVLESPMQNGNGAVGGAIPEDSQEKEDSIAEMCQQLTQGLTALTGGDPFSEAPRGPQLTHQASLPASSLNSHAQTNQAMLTRQHTSPASQTLQPVVPTSTNPWGGSVGHPQPQHKAGFNAPGWAAVPATSSSSSSHPQHQPGQAHLGPAAVSTSTSNPFSAASHAPPVLNGGQPTVAGFSGQHGLTGHGRSHSIDTGEMAGLHWHQQQHHNSLAPRHNGAGNSVTTAASSAGAGASASANSNPWPTSAPPVPSSSAQGPGMDPFDVAWAAKSVNTASPNPFGNKQTVKQFEVQL